MKLRPPTGSLRLNRRQFITTTGVAAIGVALGFQSKAFAATAPQLPSGLVFVTDSSGNLLVDAEGRYLVAQAI